MAKCSHRVYNIIGKNGDMRVKCSVCKLVGARGHETAGMAYIHRVRDFRLSEEKGEKK